MPSHSDGLLLAPPPALPPRDSRAETQSNTGSSGAQQFKGVLSFATGNVQTLYQGQDGCAGKIDFLQSQFASHQLHLIGLQETRGHSGLWDNRRFLRLATAGEGGQGGVELWVNLQIHYGTAHGRRLFLQKHHFVVIDRSPRHLICRVQAPSLDFVVLVAHAPHSGYAENEVEAFWEDLCSRLRPAAHLPLVVLADANSQLGSSDGLHVLDICDEPSKHSEHLRHFLRACQLWAPSTDPKFGPWTPTWTSPDGRFSWQSSCTDCAVLPEIELTLGEHDHRVVATTVEMHLTAPPVTRHKSKHVIDKTRIKDTDGLAEALCQVPRIPWSHDVETQAADITTHITHSIAQSCASPPATPKKPYVCDQTWLLRQELRKARAELRQLACVDMAYGLRWCFRAWFSSVQGRRPLSGVAYIQQTQKIHALQKDLKSMLRSNKRRHLRAAIDGLHPEASASTILRTLKPFRGSSNAKFFGPPPLPEVLDETGQPCLTASALQDRWVRYLASMEGGVRLSNAALRDKWIDDMEKAEPKYLDASLDDLPSLSAVEYALSRVQCGKATGPDEVPGEVCHHHPRPLARAMLPMVWKLVLHCQEPLIYKGGRATTAWKRKLPQNRCEAYRALLVSSHLGKAMHRSLRDHQSHLYEAFLQADQIGGRRHVPVSLGTHMMRAFLRHSQQHRRAASVVFLDLTEAFYRTLREITFGDLGNDSTVACWVERLGLPSDTLHQLHAQMKTGAVFQNSSYSQLQQNIIKTLHSSTWFRVDRQEDTVMTTVGSRPGDSYADIVFGLLFSHVLKGLQACLRQEQLLTLVSSRDRPSLWAEATGLSEDFLGPTWMDDLSIAVAAKDSHELLSKTARVTGHLLDHCRKHGMQPNLQRNKTEILMVLKGRGSRELAPQLFSDAGPRAIPVLTDTGVVDVKVVSQYKHLGTTLHHSGFNGPELRQRMAQAHQAFGEHSRLLLRNQALDNTKRIQLFDSLVLSKLTYGMETWLLATDRQADSFESSLLRLYRRLLPYRPEGYYTKTEIMDTTGLPAGPLLRRRARLRYLGTIFKCADRHVWSVLHLDEAWIKTIHEDLHWMWQQLRGSSSLPDPSSEWSEWEALLQNQPKRWKKLVKRAVQHELYSVANARGVATTHADLHATLCAHGMPPPLNMPEPAACDLFGCLSCRLRFRSKAGEAVHMNRVHGRRAKVRQLIDGTHCAACLKEFHTITRIQRHLEHSHHCRTTLLAWGHDGGHLPGIGSARELSLQAAHDGLLPTLQAHGPQRPAVRMRPDFADYRLDFEQQFHDFLMDASVYPLTAQIVETYVREQAVSLQLTWTDLCRTLEVLQASYGRDETTATGLAAEDLAACFSHLLDPDSWPWETENVQQQPRASLDTAAWMEQFEQSARMGGVRHVQAVPRPCGAHRVFLHLFAGRRRPGDIQFYLDRWVPPAGITFHVISLDVIYDAEWGNLCKARPRRFCLEAIHAQWVLALVAGPPCETWTAARYVALSAEHTGPRPVRSADQLWGLDSMRLREWVQVILGNVLLGFSLEAITAILVSSGMAVLEHPAEPEGAAMPSIWKLPAIRALRRHPSVRVTRILQGHFGAVTAKPTMLLTVNLPNIETMLWDQRLTETIPAGSSIGKNADGTYKTSPLKEYPPGLCKALATILSARASCQEQGCSAQPTSFWSRVCTMQVQYGRRLGPDCAA
eukprot:Skav222445  [mRNA]  locus=scaffold993:74343:79400:+ [translate_table: standard]